MLTQATLGLHRIADVSDLVAVTELVDGIAGRHGRGGAVFANAGIARGRGPITP